MKTKALQLGLLEQSLLSLLLYQESSPVPSTIEDAVLPSYIADSTQDTGHQEFCRALTAFMGPV